jgi:surface antigen
MMLLVIAASVAWAAAGMPARAQINPFKTLPDQLTPEDLRLLKQAAAKLYIGETARAGTVEGWRNPESGNSGGVKLVKIFKTDGMTCRRLQHRVRLKGQTNVYEVVQNRCRMPDGSWKVL